MQGLSRITGWVRRGFCPHWHWLAQPFCRQDSAWSPGSSMDEVVGSGTLAKMQLCRRRTGAEARKSGVLYET